MHPQHQKGSAYPLLVLLLLLPAARAAAQTPSQPTETNQKIGQDDEVLGPLNANYQQLLF